MHKPALLGSIALFAGSVLCQDNMGLLRNVDMTFSARGEPVQPGPGLPFPGLAATVNPSVQFTRIDTESYAAWGYDDSNPSSRTFSGLHFRIQDFDGATADTFSLVAYTESAAQPGFPDVANPLVATGTLSMPLTPPGLAAFDVTVNFATPMTAPAAADVFVGLSQNGVVTSVFANDGMTVWMTTAEPNPSPHQVLWSIRDLPGAAAPATSPQNTYAGYYVPSSPYLGYVLRAQWHIEPILISPAGVASAWHHGDTLHPAANVSPGTSCMLSSLYPDARSPSFNAGRADDLGMTFLDAGIVDNSPVIWLAEISPGFGPEIPLASVLPGSLGALCMHPSSVVIVGVTFTLGGQATHVIAFPAALRPMLANTPLVQQAVAFDPSLAVFRSGPCQISWL